MNNLAVQRQSRSLLPELSELLNGLPTFAGLRPFFDSHLLRLEDQTLEGLYQVRAELPGVDPVEDVEVTVRDGQLTIKAERSQTNDSDGRSEFCYGAFERTVPLPVGANEDEIRATYDRGILTISVPLSDDVSSAKHVEVIETILFEDEDESPQDEDEDESPQDDEQEASAG